MRSTAVEAAVTDALDRIKSHPLIVSSHSEGLSKGQATRWVFCAGRESRTFPEILRELLTWSSNEVVREVLTENLEDELGRGDPDDAHFNHYLKLLDQLGLPRQQFYDYDERAGIRLALSLAYNVANSRAEGTAIGYMLVNEAMTPVTYEAARSALTKHYPHLRTDFFDLHIAVDEEHVQALYEAVAALDESTTSDLMFGIALGERGMAVLLDEAFGVYDHYTGTPTIQEPAVV